MGRAALGVSEYEETLFVVGVFGPVVVAVAVEVSTRL